MRNIWISVPSYWTCEETVTPAKPGIIFDHPTPLGTKGTLPRMLESFCHLNGDFKVLIIAASTHPEFARAVHAHVAGLLEPFKNKLDLYLVSAVNLDRVNQALSEPILSLTSYGTIRNVQLCVPFGAGAEAVVGIDDDEIITDPEYLNKLIPLLGTTVDGDVVAGMAGPYFDSNGEYRIAGAKELAACDNIFLKKNFFMNQALEKYMEDPRKGLVKSNVAFGGNMVMSRATITTSCHDPFIARGEDYDYVLNAAMDGHVYFMNRETPIVHLPPDSTGSQAGDNLNKLISDIRRFIYMQAKWQYHQLHFPAEKVDLDYMMPYPGPYLDSRVDLENAGISALQEKYPEFCKSHSPQAIVDEAVAAAKEQVPKFFIYREKWKRVMADLNERPFAESDLPEKIC